MNNKNQLRRAESVFAPLERTSIDFATRFGAILSLSGESLGENTAWFNDRLKSWEIPDLELFLKFAESYRGKFTPTRDELFDQFSVALNRIRIDSFPYPVELSQNLNFEFVGGISC